MAEPLFINPFTDFSFKKIFGEEQNKDLLIDFLNELLAAQNQHISNFDKWLFVIKNLHKLDHIPERIQERVFQKLFKVASYTALSKEEKAKYEDSLKYYNDLKNSLDTAQEEGYQEGYHEAQALYEAKLEQEKQRAEQEKQRAAQEKQRAEQELELKENALRLLEKEHNNFVRSVLNMHEIGLSSIQIAQITNRSVAEIEAILQGEGK